MNDFEIFRLFSVKKYLFLMTYLLFSNTSVPNSNIEFTKLVEQHFNIVKDQFPSAILIEHVDYPEVSYSYHENMLLMPASVQKLLTAAVALRYWKSSHVYETILYEDAENLYLVFSGDPNFEYSDLKKLLSHLSDSKKWKNLYLIDNWSIVEEKAPSWMFEDMPSSYASPISSVLINRNRIDYHLMAAEDELSLPRIALKAPYIFENQMKTVGAMDKVSVNIVWENNKWIFKGSLPVNGYNVENEYSISDIKSHAIYCVQACLKEQYPNLNIYYEKRLFVPECSVIAKHTSLPFEQTLIPAMQDSDNVYFDAIFLKIAQEVAGSVALTWEEAAIVFKQLAKRLLPELDLSLSYFADGSGLSTKNSCSVRLIGDLLKFEKENQLFINSLAFPGGFGSFNHRFLSLKDQLKAKIGGFSNVSTLAGYLYLDKKPQWRFVIFMNGVGCYSNVSENSTRDFQEKLLKSIMDWSLIVI